jgi:inner membrane transporter RhtA
MPPVGLVLLAVSSVQVGGAVAKTLFDELGPGGTVFLRVLFAAAVLAAVWRPGIRGLGRRELALVALFGLSLAGMNGSFYLALDRLPLGVAVTFEFVGPLGVAVAGSRKPLDVLWVVLAAAGILLLAGPVGGDIDGLGVFFALLAGAFWAAYILLSARVGQEFEGGGGLALAMLIASALLIAPGVADAGDELLDTRLLLLGALVAMLSSAIPYSLELEALRRLPKRVFGVLMSLEPAVAAAAGFVVLGEVLDARELLAIGLVVAASAGATRTAKTVPRDG